MRLCVSFIELLRKHLPHQHTMNIFEKLKAKEKHFDSDDAWSVELESLLQYGRTMELEAVSEKFEMMDDEKLEFPIDLFYEFRPIKDAKDAKAREVAYQERHLAAYGWNEVETMDLMCHETSTDIQEALNRSAKRDELQSKIRELKELYMEKEYTKAHVLGKWLLEQDGRFGVGYNHKLFFILKTLVARIAKAACADRVGGFISITSLSSSS
jgi:hypothetical protein